MSDKRAVPTHDIDPHSHPREFRRCLGQFATGVTVVTARVRDELVGMTVNSFSSLSLDPPLILWSVDRKSSRFPLFQAAEHFAINILTEKQIGLSRHFGAASPDMFRNVAWSTGRNGSPLLDDTAAFLECARYAEHEGGDHLIVLGRVERAVVFDRNVLLFSQGRYRVPADHPDDMTQPDAMQSAPPAQSSNALLLSDLFRANHKLSAAFSRYREGMTRDQHRVLISIERVPGIRFDALARHTFLGVQAAEDALSALLADGSVRADAQGGFELTPAGRERRRALVERLAAMESELLKDIPDHVIQAGRILLAHLAADEELLQA